jgi:exodeoxyribonuclease VII large subunit
LKLLNPENILKRGYSITCFNNKVVKDSDLLNVNDEIITTFYKGKIKSRVR